jgi:hypothetical protein
MPLRSPPVDPATGWRVVGVDPAPSKPTVAFDGACFHTMAPDAVDAQIAALTGGHDRVLLLWDAPLQMDPGAYYSRAVDVAAKEMVASWSHVLEDKAVGIAAAAQCPHNILSMAVLGLPIGAPRHGLRLLDDAAALASGGRWVAEVHPAVALGWWYAQPSSGALRRLPRYKGRVGAVAAVRADLAALLSPQRAFIGAEAWACLDPAAPGGGGPAITSDDQLDAWVAWLLGRMLLAGRAQLWRGAAEGPGQASGGHYVMPT